jgi:hypothetical protein
MNDTADFAGTAIRMDIGRSDAVITILVTNFLRHYIGERSGRLQLYSLVGSRR